ncbi:MAG: hypothetical protein P4L79_01280 [Legionella sp.]|uniref:hypothetical protein n=1 Tax=Legionella sp. TaxID=459 RepID=UPI002847E302|nr:hypothetical protein [Legionella sp.]
MNKKILIGFISLLFFSSAHAEEKASLEITTHPTQKPKSGPRAKLAQAITIQVTQNNNCLAQPGSVTIKNNSLVHARNIQAIATDPNYAAYIVAMNNCPALLAPGASCTIAFYTNAAVSFLTNVLIKGSNTNNTYFNLNAFVCTPSMTSSVPNLGLAVKGSFTGNTRQFFITNNTFMNAQNISVQASNLPNGTTYTTTCSGTLAIGNSCSITVTPGPTVSADAQGNPCTMGRASNAFLTVNATQTIPTKIGISVVNYGCIYQSGFVFSIDDTQGCSSSPCTGGVGGKIISLIDLDGVGLPWNSSHDLIPGIDNTSTSAVGAPSYSDFLIWFVATYPTLTPLPSTAFNQCEGPTDGACNSGNILAFYNEYITIIPASNPPHATALDTYAAGYCSLYSGGGYTNWYLPAICELGKEPSYEVCGSITTDNVVTNLSMLVNSCNLGSSCLSGNYWASTEWNDGTGTSDTTWAWYQYFAGSSSVTHFDVKDMTHLIRCARALT